jgi:hypothetical protein
MLAGGLAIYLYQRRKRSTVQVNGTGKPSDHGDAQVPEPTSADESISKMDDENTSSLTENLEKDAGEEKDSGDDQDSGYEQISGEEKSSGNKQDTIDEQHLGDQQDSGDTQESVDKQDSGEEKDFGNKQDTGDEQVAEE